MKKTTIYFNEDLERGLGEISRRRGVSRAALIREAVERMIADDERPPRKPRALGASGYSDTAERVDEILAEGFGE